MKKITHLSKWNLFRKCKAGSTFENHLMHHTNRLKEIFKNPITISIDAKEKFNKIQNPIHDKNSQETRIKLIEGINSKKTVCFSHKIGNKARISINFM